MDIVEFITFIAAMLFLLVSSRRKRERENPEEVEAEDQEQAVRLREFLQTVNNDMKESTKKMASASSHSSQTNRKQQKPKPSKPLIKESEPSTYHSPAGNGYANEEKAFELKVKDAYAFVKQKNSRAHHLVSQLKNPKEMILLHEIIGPPKAMKPEGPFGEFPR